MSLLRVIGDVHAQTDRENLVRRGARPYLEIIADAPASVQLGDMGDGETYDQLLREVDPARHRFFPGNHDHYDRLPPHSLGDFGPVELNGVAFFFVRGAASKDREKLVRMGRQLGKRLWFEEEELTDEQMAAAEAAYLVARPRLVITHDAPTEIARLACRHANERAPAGSQRPYHASRTSDFLARLLDQHRPRLWLFGHYHRDWSYREQETHFVCVGELSHRDINGEGGVQPIA